MGLPKSAQFDSRSADLFSEKQLLVIFSNAAEKNDYLKQAKLRLEKKSSLYIFESMNSSCISEEIGRFHAGGFLFCVQTALELEAVTRALTDLREVINKRMVHVIGLCDLENPAALETLKQMGAEVFPLSLEWEQLEPKIDRFCEIMKSEYPESMVANLPIARELKVRMTPCNPKDSRSVEALPLELEEDQILLDVESTIFTPGQEVRLTINSGFPDFLTKISQVIPTDGGRDAVSVMINSQLKDELTSVRDAQTQAQAKIFDFLRIATGR